MHTSENVEIGFMQGRLSPMIDGKIQAFPASHWREEFRLAAQAGFNFIEWTIDYEGLYENPIMTSSGREEILALSREFQVQVKTLTGDAFMQRPFWRASGQEADKQKEVFEDVFFACSACGVDTLVVPLVDNGSLENVEQENILTAYFQKFDERFSGNRTRIAFEIDKPPAETLSFIERLPFSRFGINYDLGNSASLGYKPNEEIQTYGHRIFNVHIKDRKFNGTTVSLGSGAADFTQAFGSLISNGYNGLYILQTARSDTDDHLNDLVGYKDFCEEIIKRCKISSGRV